MARMDSDDICDAKRIETQIRYFEQHPDISVLGSWCIEFHSPGVPVYHKRLPVTPEDVPSFAVYRSPLAHPTVIFRRSVFDAGYRYDPSLPQMQDYDLWCRLVIGGYRIGNVPEYLLWYRMAENFYRRRDGWFRASNEIRMRFQLARHMGLLRPSLFVAWSVLLVTRMAPGPLKKLAYDFLR